MTDRTPASPVEDLDNRVRRIVERTANMGACSQTHHEHLARDAAKVDAALQAQDHTITKGGLREAALRVIEVVDEPTPVDDGTPEVEAGWYLAWEQRHREAVDALRAALEPTHD